MGRHYEIDGLQLPSVTTITEMLSKPALYGFYGKYGTKEARRLATEAANTGTMVHEYVQSFFEETDIPHIPSDHNEALQAVRNFHEIVDHYKPEMVLSEQMVYSKKYGFAGTLDALMRINGKLVLCDWKTSSAIYEDYHLQLHAYLMALTEMVECGIIDSIEGEIADMWIIRLDKKKDVKIARDIKKLKFDYKTWQAFLGLKKVFDWKQNLKEKTK